MFQHIFKLKNFIKKNINQIRMGGLKILIKKISILFKIFLSLPLYVLSFPILIILYIIKPWVLVRFNNLQSSRIGHFTVNTELYCCKKSLGINQPKQTYIDLFYLKDVCNYQVAKMWKRVLKILPSFLLSPLHNTNQFLSKFIVQFKIHEVENIHDSDRDIYDLFEKTEPHLQFTPEEKDHCKREFNNFGLTEKSKFVCLIVRDSAYLNHWIENKDWKYHDYRNWNINNFVLAAEELTRRGYFVFRMGKKVLQPFPSSNPMIIDYANSDFKSDFMDIYLGSKCSFCITTGVGYDGIPYIFRRPILWIDVPIYDLPTYSDKFLLLTKHHIWKKDKRKLTLLEILSNVPHCFRHQDFDDKGVELIENSPEEIKDIVIEMIDRLERKWLPDKNDEILQEKFWKIFLSESLIDLKKKQLHGNIKARFGAKFLRDNSAWLK